MVKDTELIGSKCSGVVAVTYSCSDWSVVNVVTWPVVNVVTWSAVNVSNNNNNNNNNNCLKSNIQCT